MKKLSKIKYENFLKILTLSQKNFVNYLKLNIMLITNLI